MIAIFSCCCAGIAAGLAAFYVCPGDYRLDHLDRKPSDCQTIFGAIGAVIGCIGLVWLALLALRVVD